MRPAAAAERGDDVEELAVMVGPDGRGRRGRARRRGRWLGGRLEAAAGDVAYAGEDRDERRLEPSGGVQRTGIGHAERREDRRAVRREGARSRAAEERRGALLLERGQRVADVVDPRRGDDERLP